MDMLPSATLLLLLHTRHLAWLFDRAPVLSLQSNVTLAGKERMAKICIVFGFIETIRITRLVIHLYLCETTSPTILSSVMEIARTLLDLCWTERICRKMPCSYECGLCMVANPFFGAVTRSLVLGICGRAPRLCQCCATQDPVP